MICGALGGGLQGANQKGASAFAWRLFPDPAAGCSANRASSDRLIPRSRD